jgi:hypothetical protein
VSNAPNVVLKARRVTVKDATLEFVNEDVQPRYRVFLGATNLEVEISPTS